ncbi:MAG: hypothetical protein O2800_05130 [Planctomycetota bacterium]|nr:hypothetical protein [Planctomycetota bacterium]
MLTHSLIAVSAVLFCMSAVPSEVVNPKVYVIPLTGQLGTDIHPMALNQVIADVKEKKPDLVIFRLNSADIDTNDYLQNDDRSEVSMFDDDQARRMIKSLKEELREFKQVMWVQDCVGFSFIFAFGWPDMYMSRHGRLWGPTYAQIAARQQHPDQEVQRKFREAMNAITGGFLQAGGYDGFMAQCMLRPEKICSVDFVGRDGLRWRQDSKGTYILDENEKDLLRFSADTADEIGLADGLVDAEDDAGLADLMYIMGYREFTPDDAGIKIIDGYVEDWRAAFEKAKGYLTDAKTPDSTDPLKELNRQRGLYDKVLKIIQRYEAAQRRLGVTKPQLKARIGEIDEKRKQLQNSKKKGGNAPGGSGGGRGFGGGLSG